MLATSNGLMFTLPSVVCQLPTVYSSPFPFQHLAPCSCCLISYDNHLLFDLHFHLVSHILLAFPESIRDISANIPLAKNHGSTYLRMFFTRLLPLILFVLPATGIDAFGQS